jgi:glycosyltransferase involved in cell wall biosynthesis
MLQGGKRLKQSIDALPKVSIVCVTFNAAKTLPELLKSISNYKTAETELIIIDGNSTDDTLQIINKNEEIIDFWISEPDSGIYDAMNKSMQYITGQWVIFLGADDLLTEGFAEMVNELKDKKTIYYGNVIYYGKEFSKVYDDYYLTKLNICHQGILYPKAVFDKFRYDTRYKVYADYHLNLRCWKDPEFKFVHSNHLIASFPEGGFSTHTKDLLFEEERDKLFKQYLKRTSYYRYLNRTIGVFGMLKRFIISK